MPENIFLIDVPPPTISGALHLGHIFSYSHMNFIANYQKHLGKDLVYPFCFDSNGLPTEKLAGKEGIRETSKIVEFAIETSKKYEKLFQDMEMSWNDKPYHTFDQTAIELANLSFQDLVNKGYAYKAEREYFYCPVTKVSVSQSEIDENGCYERSGAKVETRIGEGWFIDILNHMPKIREAIDQITWHPENLKHRLHRWLDDVKHDWSISRERNFGIPIPGEKEGIVFDTWFTSSLTPQMAWSAYIGKPTLECPVFDARFQAHDIIRTWALFTIIKSLYHNNQIPWKNIVISGHVLDKDGKKLSKSAGNAGDPYRYINQYGSAGVKYWAAHYQSGTDGKIDENLMRNAKRLKTKIINAQKFIDMNSAKRGQNTVYEMTWDRIEADIRNDLESFNYTSALRKLDEYFWNEFCGKMIEESKTLPAIKSLHKILKSIKGLYKVFLNNSL